MLRGQRISSTATATHIYILKRHEQISELSGHLFLIFCRLRGRVAVFNGSASHFDYQHSVQEILKSVTLYLYLKIFENKQIAMRSLYNFRPSSPFNFSQIASVIVSLIPPLSPLSNHLVIYISESLPTLRHCSCHHVVEVRELFTSFDHLLCKFKTSLHALLQLHYVACSQFYFFNRSC